MRPGESTFRLRKNLRAQHFRSKWPGASLLHTPDGGTVGAELGSQVKFPRGNGRGDVAAFRQGVGPDEFEPIAGFYEVELAGTRGEYHITCRSDGRGVKLIMEGAAPSFATGLRIVTPGHSFIRNTVDAVVIDNTPCNS